MTPVEGAVSKSLPIITGDLDNETSMMTISDYQAIGSIGVVIFVRYVPVKSLINGISVSFTIYW